MRKNKLLILSDSNLNPMVRFLEGSYQDLTLEVTEAPYNQVNQVLMNSDHSVWSEKKDMLLLWTSPEKVIPSFNKLLEYKEINIGDVLNEVDQFCELIIRAEGKAKHIFVVSWSLPPHYRWIQSMTLKHNVGLSNVLMQMNLRLSERLQEHEHVIILDSSYWYAAIQQKSYDAKMYALGKIQFSRDFFLFVSNELKSIISGLYGQSKKLIICDLDNTLWGGVIGDDGIDNIKLGGIDPVGESFKLFQQELHRLSNRGVILAICSKNSEPIALEMIEQHPEMILRKKDFSSIRINWNDKAANVVEIVKELNLGLQSVVFLDDNPSERDRIKQALPEVYVPDLPIDVTQYPVFISQLDCFETPAITLEDRKRTDWFKQEQKRESIKLNVESLEEWLHSLEIKLTPHKLNKLLLTRAVQLMNKTNQFNMATRRFTIEEYWSWSELPNNHAILFEVEDKFGNAGYTGLISVSCDDEGQAEIHDFVMSCRVMGKGIEEAMLYLVTKHFSPHSIKGMYIKTEKNKPFYDFISKKYRDVSKNNELDLGEIFLPHHILLKECSF
ncbi:MULTISPECIES: HAD-IIIC family phosphatase [Paenibacillus]|jgi:FkbH-like protein|uniref:FkbH-like protein n=2 Tax=Paenibacillus TaxID=44249 RepID=A0ABX2ZDM3_PAEPO|nr:MULTISPECIES: HAD-IIIC family phosphatase [Paenibacillus]ALA44191.1 FkbH-like protein [Paenibacillus peoriae]APB74007.1 FkbH-like protein [Paenibacillus polymyxa]APQ61486.1 FkbH-like protein [Paenibacillus polymyxa]KAF6578993.1 HAD-IIIC family phosphatase [Paenibacillus sp. EKM212P]MBP1173361.1 FkbH-like protein [Paenibacillus sp. PvR133]